MAQDTKLKNKSGPTESVEMLAEPKDNIVAKLTAKYFYGKWPKQRRNPPREFFTWDDYNVTEKFTSHFFKRSQKKFSQERSKRKYRLALFGFQCNSKTELGNVRQWRR